VPFASGVNFRSFTRGFFEWEGEWASRKRKRRKRISEGHCKRQAGNLENHLLPVLGNLKLEAIDENVIDELIDELDEKGISARTINHSLVTLSHIMQTAMKKGLISMIPPIEKLGIQNIERGIITIQEFMELRSLTWKSRARTYCYSHRLLDRTETGRNSRHKTQRHRTGLHPARRYLVDE
jgi:hypothetical protein